MDQGLETMKEGQGMDHESMVDQLKQAIQRMEEKPSDMGKSETRIKVDMVDEGGIGVDLLPCQPSL